MLSFLNNLLTCQNPDPDLARRGRLLAIFMATVMALDLVLLVNNLIGLANPAGTPEEYTWEVINTVQDVLAFAAFAVLLVLNHRGHQRIAALIFSLLSMLFTFTFKPTDIAIFAIIYVPFIIAPSFVLAPAAAFLFAALSSLAYNLYTYSDPVAWAISWSIITPVVFFLVAAVSWLAARSLERALRGEREQTAKVRTAYEQITARAQELAETLRREHETQSGQVRPDDPRTLGSLTKRLWQDEHAGTGARVAHMTESLEDLARSVAAEMDVPPEQVIALITTTARDRAAGLPAA